MNTQPMNANNLDPAESWVYRLGGIAVLLNAISALVWLFLVGYRLYRLAS